MNNRVISICNTPLQIINTINLMVTDYKDFDFDLIITDEIKNHEPLFMAAKKSGHFRNVYYAKIHSFIYSTLKKDLKFAKPSISKKLNLKKVRTFLPDITSNYDVVMFANIDDRFINLFLTSQKKLKDIVWFEEGCSSYSTQGVYWSGNSKKTIRGVIKFILKGLKKSNYSFKHTTKQYLYCPELAQFDVPFLRMKLEFLSKNKDKIIFIANSVFNYRPDDLLSRRFIYFEESYRIDGFDINDSEILAIISDIVGRDNLTVKVHPRSDPKFSEGYYINKNTEIPWELYYLNNPDVTNVLISISSSCIISPLLNFGNRQKVLCLVNFLRTDKLDKSRIDYINFLKSKIFKKNSDVFLLPKDVEELKGYLKKLVYL